MFGYRINDAVRTQNPRAGRYRYPFCVISVSERELKCVSEIIHLEVSREVVRRRNRVIQMATTQSENTTGVRRVVTPSRRPTRRRPQPVLPDEGDQRAVHRYPTMV
jgi:hypothetical protein